MTGDCDVAVFRCRWHGIALRNDIDGACTISRCRPFSPQGRFVYRFTVPDAGTRRLHAAWARVRLVPVCARDRQGPTDPVAFDVDVTLMLDDWLDSYGRTQQQVLAALQSGGRDSGHMDSSMGAMNGTGSMAGGLAGDVAYHLHVINGSAAPD